MTYNNCVKQIISELKALPPSWAEKLACNICNLVNTTDECNIVDTDCTDIRNCQTVTSLSNFEISGNNICISFKDENEVVVKRCFTFSQLNNGINNTDGTCLNPLWGTLYETEKWQAIIDNTCECCEGTTTTTTTSSTTTTTTAGPCTCFTWEIINLTGNSHSFTYIDCNNISHTPTVLAGEKLRFCACYEHITYNNQYFILGSIADICISTPSCETCNQYRIVNNNVYPVEVFYTDCYTLLQTSIWALADQKAMIDCACTDSIILTPGIEIQVTSNCPEITTSTTTTTTDAGCACYRFYNPGAPGSPVRWVDYINCNGISLGVNVNPGEFVFRCAKLGSPSGFGVELFTVSDVCTDICDETVTTTTTTTAAPTTTTTTTSTTTTSTTTTTSSTTTTTTLAVENDYVYFTNSPSLNGTGAKVYFSTHDYYTPNTPTAVTSANCLNISDLGPNPVISITVQYWKDDVQNDIGNGSGGYRAADGTKTIVISTDGLSYNVSSGAWQKGSGIFTSDEGTNIAAFKITAVTSPYNYGVSHIINLPPADHFIRVHDTFGEGGSSAIFFDLG